MSSSAPECRLLRTRLEQSHPEASLQTKVQSSLEAGLPKAPLPLQLSDFSSHVAQLCKQRHVWEKGAHI